MFFLCRQAWEAFTPEAPQRSEDFNKHYGVSHNIPVTAKPVFHFLEIFSGWNAGRSQTKGRFSDTD
ncbi:hypothetical protein IQ91_24915 [Salmonella enterica]|nr:hypothetical protein [Salmonella enterica]